MNITISKKQARVLVTIIELDGQLDSTSHNQLIDETKRIHLDGTRDLLIDLSKLTYMNSTGLAAIYKTAALFRDQPKGGDESGRATYHPFERENDSLLQKHVKLLCPQPRVSYILDVASFRTLFEIFTDLNTAVSSF